MLEKVSEVITEDEEEKAVVDPKVVTEVVSVENPETLVHAEHVIVVVVI